MPAQGRDSLPAEWAEFYFKWWGVYTQGDGVGVTGGKDGEGKATEYFMMRIALPNGLLTSHQLRVIGELTKKYANNLADITTRQNIQLHWLTIDGLVDVVDALTAVGLFPKGACGDVDAQRHRLPARRPRRARAHRRQPARRQQIARGLTGNPEFYNLPRKFKVTVTGCPLWCSYPEINDVALTAIKREVNGLEEIGYTLRVGGGLSTEPHIAVRIPAFIPQDKAYAVVEAVLRIFKDAAELRENRTRARIKYLFMRHGWTAETMLEAIEAKLGYKLDPSPVDEDESPTTSIATTSASRRSASPASPPSAPRVLARPPHRRATDPARGPRREVRRRPPARHHHAEHRLRQCAERARARLVHRARTTIGLQRRVHARSGAAPSPAPAPSSASSPSPRPRPSPSGSSASWKTASPASISRSGCTSPAAPTPAASTGSPTSASKARRSRRTARWSTPSTSASAAPSASTPASRRQVGYRAAAEDCPEAIERLLRAYLAARKPGEDLAPVLRPHTTTRASAPSSTAPGSPPVERDPAPVGAGRLAGSE